MHARSHTHTHAHTVARVQEVDSIITNPSSALSLLGTSVPGTSAFYINWLMLQGLCVCVCVGVDVCVCVRRGYSLKFREGILCVFTCDVGAVDVDDDDDDDG